MAIAGTVPTELGDKRIRDLLMQYAVPAIIAMTASSLYNMVDSIYIGHIKVSAPTPSPASRSLSR